MLAAALFDAEPLYVGGVAFLLLAAVCVAWVVSGANGLRVQRRVPAGHVVEDEPLAVDVRPDQCPRAAVVHVEDPLLAEPTLVRGGRRTVTLPIEARFARRGRHTIDPPVVIVRDPLGLARREVEGDGATRFSSCHASSRSARSPRRRAPWGP